MRNRAEAGDFVTAENSAMAQSEDIDDEDEEDEDEDENEYTQDSEGEDENEYTQDSEGEDEDVDEDVNKEGDEEEDHDDNGVVIRQTTTLSLSSPNKQSVVVKREAVESHSTESLTPDIPRKRRVEEQDAATDSLAHKRSKKA